MKAQVKDDKDQKTVTDEVDSEGDEVTRCIPFEKYLGT
jgi:hypothetical protein